MTPSGAGRSRKVRDEFVDYVVEQLAGAGDVTVRSMFGGHGLSCDGVFFGLIDEGEVYIKTDDAARPDFIARGMSAFEPWPGHVMNGYWRVPAEVIEDAETFAAWSRRAMATARAKKATKATKPKRARSARRPAAK